MTTVNIIPNLDRTTSGTVTIQGGSPSMTSAVTDASDSTFVRMNNGGYAYMYLSTFTLPAGAVTVSATASVRPRIQTFGSSMGGLDVTLESDGTVSFAGAVAPNWYGEIPLVGAFATWTLSPKQLTVTQAQLDTLEVKLHSGNGGGAVSDWAEVSFAITYATQPTVVVNTPTGTVTTSTAPSLAWTYTQGSDGGPQTAYQVRTFTAAQYGAGGFDPSTSVATHDTGPVFSSSTTATVGPLLNATYRSYVRAAQTINGVQHWSNYAFTGYVINPTTSDITSVVATQLSATARNQIVVTRNGATPLWTSVEVQASYDAGATWTDVRGYTRFAPPSSPFTLFDYEAPNGTAATYRARATYQLSGLDITGAFVTSSAVTWSGTDLWLKDIGAPSRNVIGNNVLMPEPTYGRAQGVFRPLGSKYAVVVSDVLQAGTSTITLETYTAAEEAALKLVCSAAVMLIQAPTFTGFGWGNRYVAPGRLTEHRKTQDVPSEWRVWDLDLTEVAQPPDAGIGT